MMPPTRRSAVHPDIPLADTSITTKSHAQKAQSSLSVNPSSRSGDVSYVSEGPTLPILRDGSEQKVEPPNGQASEASKKNKKKRKLRHDAGGNSLSHATAAEAAPSALAANTSKDAPGQTLSPALFEPWTLLPRDTRDAIESTYGRRETVVGGAQSHRDDTFWKDKTTVLVFTKNQNIKSAVNKLQSHLRQAPQTISTPTTKVEVANARGLKQDNGSWIAVSAQGDATAKLVGIIELVKRVLAPSGDGTAEAGTCEGAAKWFAYNCLSNQKMLRHKMGKGSKPISEQDERPDGDDSSEPHQRDERDEGLVFETLEAIKARDEQAQQDTVLDRVPVLVVWLSRSSIPKFKSSFGEQVFWVSAAEKDEG